MTIISAPAAAGTDIDGSQYNSLRQDLLVNHVHDGSDGARIDHDDLADDGVRMGDNRYSHVELDQHVDATTGVHGAPPGYALMVGPSAALMLQHGVEYPSWTGSGWESHSVIFPTSFKAGTTPTVLISPKGTGWVDGVYMQVGSSVSNTAFDVDARGMDTGVGVDSLDHVGFSWLAIGGGAMTFGRVVRVSDTRIDVRADNGARYTNVLLPAGSTVSPGDRAVLAWDAGRKRWVCLALFKA